MHFTQEQFAQKMQVKRSLIGSYEEGRAEPRLDYLKKMAGIFGITVDELISKDVTEKEDGIRHKEIKEDQKSNKSFTGNQPVERRDILSRNNIVTIPWVSYREMENYRFKFSDPHFIANLPSIVLPVDHYENELRAFEVTEDGLPQLSRGSIIVGKYLHELNEIRDHQFHILLLKSRGILFRSIENSRDQNGRVKILSPNPSEKPSEISVLEIDEIWEARILITNFLLKDQDDQKKIFQKNEWEYLHERVNALNQELESLKRQFRRFY